MKMHYMIGNGVLCNLGLEAPNSCDDWDKVTCRNCLRLRAQGIRRNMSLLEGYLERGTPPLLRGQNKWAPLSMQERLEEYRAQLASTEAKLEAA